MKNHGFTIVEIIITLAILTLVAGLTFNFLAAFRSRAVLRSDAENLISLLTKARSETLAARDRTSYGVRLEEERAILFIGASYSGSGEELRFAPTVRASSTLQGGGREVVFQRLTGVTENWGTTTLSSGNQSLDIIIDSSGLVHL